jgi:DNA-binding Xre family transcriptional regulator
MKTVLNRFNELLAIKQRQEKRAISRRQVARETKISLSSINNWANNAIIRFDALQIAAFCQYFRCTVDELLIIVDSESDALPELKTPLSAA